MRTLPTYGGPARPTTSWLTTGLRLALAVIMVVTGLVLGFGSAPSAAQSTTTEDGRSESSGDPGRVSVIKAEGLLDPVLASFIDRSVRDAGRAGMIAVVIQLDSSGSVVPAGQLERLARTIAEAPLPVAVWVGPSGSVALGGAAQIAGVADSIGLAHGTRLGKTGSLQVPEELLSPAFRAAQGRLENGTITESQARKLGIMADRRAAVIGEFIIGLDGVETRVVTHEGRQVTEPVSVPVFSSLPVQDQLFHTVSSPAAAYLLFLIGMALIVFEMFTAGVGVAGLVGAGSFALGCYGLAVLPVRPIGLALLVLSMVAFTVDVQVGVPRFWTGVGSVALVAGSLLVFDGLGLTWITLLVGIGGTVVFFVWGMPAMVRTRFSTPTIERSWLINEVGESVSTLDPEGVVRVREALWPSRTRGLGSVAVDSTVRVVGIEGVLLEVEPVDGERSGRGEDASVPD